MAITIQELLKIAVERDASDLHLTTHIPPRIRIDGSLVTLDYPPLSPAETKTLAYSLLTDRQKKQFEEKLELDFSFGVKEMGRFRGRKGQWQRLFAGSCPQCGAFLSLAFPSVWPSSVFYPGDWFWSRARPDAASRLP